MQAPHQVSLCTRERYTRRQKREAEMDMMHRHTVPHTRFMTCWSLLFDAPFGCKQACFRVAEHSSIAVKKDSNAALGRSA